MRTIVEKIAESHLAAGSKGPVRAGDFVTLRPRHILTHDNTAAVMGKFRTLGTGRIDDPRQPVFVLDHDIQNQSEVNLRKYSNIKDFADSHGVDFYPAGTGIGHQVMVAMGYVTPGSLVVASDSHANMYGALSALGTPVVRTDAAAVWATGEFWWQIPPTVQVVLEGELRPGVTGKDVILTLCSLYSHGEVLNMAVEFAGPGVRSLSMDERFTIANMTTEWGALVGWFPCDASTVSYLREVRERLVAGGRPLPFTEDDLQRWAEDPPRPDPDAAYRARIRLDLSAVGPRVTGPDTVQASRPLVEVERERIAIQKAYLVSCVNSRLSDIEAAASVVGGRKVAEGVELYVAAASAEIEAEAETSGAWDTLLSAGAIPLPPGCGPCIGLGAGLLEPGEVGISATNRNFKGRMGSREAQAYLASPEVVVESAIRGYIAGPTYLEPSEPEYRLEPLGSPAGEAAPVELLPDFPHSTRGRLVYLPADNLNTDGIYSKTYTYREGMTQEEMARVVMENYDPEFASRTREGDILVGGRNFGTGSSREQAATALKAKGIQLVIAASFSQTYLRNAYNNGFLCLECPELVDHLAGLFRDEVQGGALTLIPGDEIEVGFSTGRVTYRGAGFRFPPPGRVAQELVLAGGIEQRIRKQQGVSNR